MANEKRLIDAYALEEEIERIYEEHYKDSCYQFIHDFFRAMLRRIRNAETVDAVEVVHGRWEDGRCTNCGARAEFESVGFNCTGGTRINYRHTNYCPNCGAKMDGERIEGE